MILENFSIGGRITSKINPSRHRVRSMRCKFWPFTKQKDYSLIMWSFRFVHGHSITTRSKRRCYGWKRMKHLFVMWVICPWSTLPHWKVLFLKVIIKRNRFRPISTISISCMSPSLVHDRGWSFMHPILLYAISRGQSRRYYMRAFFRRRTWRVGTMQRSNFVKVSCNR